jgi:hypothetical protein
MLLVKRIGTILARPLRPWFDRSRRFQAGILTLVVTATSVFAAPAPGMAYGDNYYKACTESYVSCHTGVYVSGTGTDVDICRTSYSYGYTSVCVRYDGDYVYVYDGAPDDNSAMARIWNFTGSETTTYRFCRNPHGYRTWARCNFDWSENATKSVYGGIRLDYDSMSLGHLFSIENN